MSHDDRSQVSKKDSGSTSNMKNMNSIEIQGSCLDKY